MKRESGIMCCGKFSDRKELAVFAKANIPMITPLTGVKDLSKHSTINLKGIVHPKMKIPSLITHPHVAPNP